MLMMNVEKDSDLSLRSSQSMSQFAVAIALISVIPLLGLFALGLGRGRSMLPENLGLASLVTILVAMVIGAVAGYMILLRQENSITRLGTLIQKLEKGEPPSKADLAATSSDFRVIENGMNMVLSQFSTDAAKIYARADLISKVLNEYNNTLQSLSFVASLALLDEPEPSELAQQRFQDIQAAILAGRRKIDLLLEESGGSVLCPRKPEKKNSVSKPPVQDEK
jgi:methyl-accepting chemotaxis protein